MTVVSTAFGRPGPAVVAELGDYTSLQIINDSDVPGTTVADANDALAGQVVAKATLAGDLGGTVGAPAVIKLQGLSISPAVPNDGDRLTWSSAHSQWEPKAPGVDPYGSLYEIDFTTLTTRDVSAPGSYTIDGLTWWLKGLQVATGGGAASGLLVNGQGLGIRTNFSIAYTAAGLSPNSYLRWFLPLAQLPKFNPIAPVCVQFRLFHNTYRSVAGGLCDSTNDAIGATSAQRPHSTQAGLDGGDPTTCLRSLGMIADASDDHTGLPHGDVFHSPSEIQFSAVLVKPGLAYVTALPWAGAYNDCWSAPLLGASNVHIKETSAQPTNLGFELTVRDQSGGGTFDYWLRSLKISQAKAV